MGHRKSTRTLSIFLALCMMLFMLPVTVSAAGRDTSEQETLAAELKELGLFQGTNNGFELERPATRVEALVMLIRILGKEQEALAGNWNHPFRDVPAWADHYIGYAYETGLTQGSGGTTFGTGDVNAAQYLTFILRSLGYSDTNGEDFTWNAPETLAKSKGILTDSVNTAEFWRADLVTVSHAALTATLKGSTQTLAEKLMAAGVFTQAQFDTAYHGNAAGGGGAALDNSYMEIAAARALGIVPAALGATVTFTQFAEMLGNVIEKSDASALGEWNTLAATALKTTDAMERDDGILALYEAACVLGLGKSTMYWNQVSSIYESLNDGYSPREGIFSNASSAAPFEPNPGQNDGWDYPTAAVHFVRGQSSSWNIAPYFTQRSATVKYSDPLTSDEAIKAAYRLYLARVSQDEGSFDIADYETDWSDPLLADAKATRDTILNSKTTITKSSAFVQGETYTGTAYYVSNSGSDSNDGKSPETAWATTKKVSSAKLNSGDAVFFERGGVWYTGDAPLQMQTGVTYSAYGKGPKPVWTGSPLSVASSAKWTLYKTTADGGKIWKYADNVWECGIMLLDNETVARKYYAIWDGAKYITRDGAAFAPESALTADLMYISMVDLTGQRLPIPNVWQLRKTGPLYFRCDAGNPGEVFDTIEIGIAADSITTADGGYNTIDNISYRCYPVSGAGCNGHDNIIFQNCEVGWCGGAVQGVALDNHNHYVIGTSGGGMLLFGSNEIGRSNYIHDCESKGIAIVNHGNAQGDGHTSLVRVNIRAEGNVVERCGDSIRFWNGLFTAADAGNQKFGNIAFTGNYFVNAAYGWRVHSQMWCGNEVGDQCSALKVDSLIRTGEVLIENNLFYRATGPLVDYYYDGIGSDTPTLRGNTYVQDEDQVLFFQRDEDERSRPAGVLAQDGMEARFKQYIGDATGRVIVKQFGQ